jgi:hypothetical protein
VNGYGTKWKHVADKAETENTLCKHLDGQTMFKFTLGSNTQEEKENSSLGSCTAVCRK